MEDDKLRTLKGRVHALRFVSGDGSFGVAVLAAGEERVPVVGALGFPVVGETLEVTGHFAEHPKFGRQFQVKEVRRGPSMDADAVAAYLSEHVKGVGPETARRISHTLGEKALELSKDEQALKSVPGIGAKRAKAIAAAARTERPGQQLTLTLMEMGLRGAAVRQVKSALGAKGPEMLNRNPYLLSEHVEGIGFKRADMIARRRGMAEDAPERAEAAALYLVREAHGQGHLFLRPADMVALASPLGIGEAAIEAAVAVLTRRGRLVVDEHGIYDTEAYTSEVGVAREVLGRLRRPEGDADQLQVASHLTPEQHAAVALALTAPISVLTGGPGTGKTTSVLGMVQEAERRGLRLALAAPTGRAARRLSEATGHPAFTLHRLLGLRGPLMASPAPVHADLIVVDECSMLDLYLFLALLRACSETPRMVLVGDEDQLPPVGPGAPFTDLIRFGVPTTRLTRLFRQSADSRLAENAHRIREGKSPLWGASDFRMLRAEADAVPGAVLSAVRRETGRVGPDELQVLCPGRRSVSGVENLNEQMQQALNPNRQGLQYGRARFWVGDKVIQTRNNYDKGVMNGEIGRVYAAGSGELKVRFPGPDGPFTAAYGRQELGQLQLGYALTVHKAQGSEFKSVILVLTTQHFLLLRRNLLYTAVTRAKERLTVVGTGKALGIALGREDVGKRNTALYERLQEGERRLFDGPPGPA